MSLTATDQRALRLGRHALRRSKVAAGLHALGAQSFAALARSNEELLAAASNAVAEAADDPPVRREREAAITDLRELLHGSLSLLRAHARVLATSRTGRVERPEILARAEDLVSKYVPDGRPSALSKFADGLLSQASTIVVGLRGFAGMEEAVTDILAGVARVEAAADRLGIEATELGDAQKRLDAAREAQSGARGLALAWTEFAARNWPSAGLDVRDIFPPLDPSRDTAEALDAAGVDAEEGAPEAAVETAPEAAPESGEGG